MTTYKKYTHVERLNEEECEGLLQNNPVYVTAKVDGTNAVVWFDGEKVCGGSRTRQLSEFSDNAGFYTWLMSDSDEAVNLRKAVVEHPEWIIYGEWLGFNKFIGQIKTYDSIAKGHMYIFDVYNTELDKYLPDPVWRANLRYYNLHPYYVELLAVLDNPTYEDIVEIAKANKFLLTHAEHTGEGVVCKAPDFRNKWGRNVYGKIVLEEFKQRLKNKNKKKEPVVREGIEADIVEYWVTEAEMTKSKAKVCVIFEADEFNKKSGKFIGYFLEMIWKDLLDEISAICKQYQNPVIDFRILRQCCNDQGRKFLGLI